MTIIQGKGVSSGVIWGKLYFYSRPDTTFPRLRAGSLAAERTRFAAAQEKTVNQLNDLAEKCREQAGSDAAALFETHAMLAEDEDFVGSIMEIMESESGSAEYAVSVAGERFSAMFAAVEDAYMQARAADILDISRRLVRNLLGVPEGGIDSDTPVVLAADDLTPSETLQMDKSKILGFVTRLGSDNSHTAILARAMGIPAVCGVGDGLEKEYEGCFVYVDGEAGQVILNPDEAAQKRLTAKYHAQQERMALLQAMRGQEDVTLDGKRIRLYCNIASPEDVAAVQANDGQGIGLFRSEFLYLASEDYPDEETQFQAYKTVLSAMGGKQVIIRTLDIGADKQVDYFGLKKEENPALGVRGIRLCLNRPEVFRTQLRALYRASAYGRLAIMFPMITSVWEVEACKQLCKAVMDELDAEGAPFNPETEIGIMVETPASVLLAEDLAKLVDFFSVGTNDLTQYTLACDRQCSDLGRFFDPHHPAVLRALRMTAEAAHRNGIWVGICGELAADISLLPAFMAMGIDELSVAPAAVLPLRQALRHLDTRHLDLDPGQS